MDDIREGEGAPVPYSKNPVDEIFSLPIFAREDLTTALISEVSPMLMAHWMEVARYPDMRLDPDWEKYLRIQEHGGLRIFTAREDGRLVGYNAFFVDTHLHYKTWRLASNDVIFINRMERGFGKHFRAFCEMKLKDEGIRVATYHVKREHAGWEKGLERDGFENVERIWVKRLDLEV